VPITRPCQVCLTCCWTSFFLPRWRLCARLSEWLLAFCWYYRTAKGVCSGRDHTLLVQKGRYFSLGNTPLAVSPKLIPTGDAVCAFDMSKTIQQTLLTELTMTAPTFANSSKENNGCKANGKQTKSNEQPSRYADPNHEDDKCCAAITTTHSTEPRSGVTYRQEIYSDKGQVGCSTAPGRMRCLPSYSVGNLFD
jgi:hypothetical protein